MLCTNFLANGYYTLHENRDYNLKVHVIEWRVVHVFITPGVRMRTKEFEGFFGVNNHPGNKKFVTINHVLKREGKFILKRIYHMIKKF